MAKEPPDIEEDPGDGPVPGCFSILKLSDSFLATVFPPDPSGRMKPLSAGFYDG